MILTSDQILVGRANSGDANAFAMLLERHYDLIYRLAYRMLGNQQDAEDIAQDVCVALPKKLVSFKGNAKFTTWLYQITLNTCRDFIRRQVSSQKAYVDYTQVNQIRNDLHEQKKQDALEAYRLIGTLQDDLRETALLIVAEGLNHAEAAEILGVKESTVSWRMLKIKEKLSMRVQREAGAL